jgi:hypothetical protein
MNAEIANFVALGHRMRRITFSSRQHLSMCWFCAFRKLVGAVSVQIGAQMAALLLF